jgi:hypothetical protein
VRHRNDDPGGGAPPSHTRYDKRRVYTDARGSFYDTDVRSVTCTCVNGADHLEVVERTPFVPNES